MGRILFKRQVLSGLYSLAEIDLKDELPGDSLQPFAADLAARAARRGARAAEQSRQDLLDAERAEAMLKSQAGPSAAELKASSSRSLQLLVSSRAPLSNPKACLLPAFPWPEPCFSRMQEPNYHGQNSCLRQVRTSCNDEEQ